MAEAATPPLSGMLRDGHAVCPPRCERRMGRTRKQSRVDLSFRPRSYWPSGKRGATEVEIARITVSSTSRDVVTLRARRAANGRIRYRMIHEDASGRTRSTIRARPGSSARCLTFGELIDLLEGACYAGPCPDEGDDERYGGVIWGTLRLNLEHGVAPADDYLFFLEVTSRHYPDLESYYRNRLGEWCLANCVEDEDCGKVVRLRTGRFPRKLVDL